MFFLAGISVRHNILYTYLTNLNNISIFVSISDTKSIQFIMIKSKKSCHLSIFIVTSILKMLKQLFKMSL